MNVLRFFCNVLKVRNAGLHLVGHFIGRNAREDFRVARRLQVHFIQILQRIQGIAPVFGPNTFGVGEEQYGVALGAKFHTLVDRRKESASPAGLAAVRLVFAGKQHDKPRQVAALASEPVGKPRAHARAADDLEAAIHEDLRGCVVELSWSRWISQSRYHRRFPAR